MFGEKLQALLDDNDISQTSLAIDLQVTAQAVSKWCNNLAQPDHETLKKIANKFNVSIDFLLGNDEKLSDYEQELREIETLRQFLIKKGYLNDNEDLTREELDNLIQFVKNNKDLLKKQ